MRKIILVSLITIIGQMAAADSNNATECYDLALAVPSAFTENGSEGNSVLIRTGGIICTAEKDMVDYGTDGIMATGKITITITNNSRKVAQYNMLARSGEGAAGTSYTSYAMNTADLEDFSGESRYKIIHFATVNHHLKRGEYAGRVEIGGQVISLIKR